jgi:hypothetical protein
MPSRIFADPDTMPLYRAAESLSHLAAAQTAELAETWVAEGEEGTAPEEEEARRISERTKDALRTAKARGVQLGNPENLTDEARRKGAEGPLSNERPRQSSGDLAPIIGEIQASGASSLRQIAAGLNERGIPTSRGGRWRAMQVRRLLVRGARRPA